jgi:hypothetical protein
VVAECCFELFFRTGTGVIHYDATFICWKKPWISEVIFELESEDYHEIRIDFFLFFLGD